MHAWSKSSKKMLRSALHWWKMGDTWNRTFKTGTNQWFSRSSLRFKAETVPGKLGHQITLTQDSVLCEMGSNKEGLKCVPCLKCLKCPKQSQEMRHVYGNLNPSDIFYCTDAYCYFQRFRFSRWYTINQGAINFLSLNKIEISVFVCFFLISSAHLGRQEIHKPELQGLLCHCQLMIVWPFTYVHAFYCFVIFHSAVKR